MNAFIKPCLLLLALAVGHASAGQTGPAHPLMTGVGTYHGLSEPLKDLPAIGEGEYLLMLLKGKIQSWNRGLEVREYPFAATALPKGPDGLWQHYTGTVQNIKTPILNISGQTSAMYPSDANGTAGPAHYMQTVNSIYAIYDKTDGALVAGPTNMNLLFSGVTGANCNDGDPLILFDEAADRWLAVEFSVCGSNDYMLVAVSQTNDPTGSWHRYSFDVDDMPDYEKFGIWKDGYYMGTNNSSGKDIYAFERSVMLSGGTPQMVAFDNPWRPATIDGFHCVPPVDNDGPQAPGNEPALFITLNDDAISGGDDELWIYELDVSWASPASSTFNRVQQISVSPFDSNFGASWDNIPQQGTTQKLDAIPMVIMNRPQYRNFGTYETIVCCHTVDVNGTNHAGIRWYELRRAGGNWTIRQSGTYAPDSHSRWMGSIALNGSNEIALGYSISSTSLFPGIRYCGQSSSAYAAASGLLDIQETTLQNGTNAQTGMNRWGDYYNMAVDPADDHTFWYTAQYGGLRQTRIAAFQFAPAGLNAAFSATPTVVCEGGQVVFTNQSTGTATSWSWSFPGGSPSSHNGPTPPPVTYSNAGTYDVTLVIGDGNNTDTETMEDFIHVTDIYADFTADNTSVFLGQSVQFTDNSGCDPLTWAWTFEGGTPSNYNGQQPPPIVYDALGSYDVILTVTKPSGSDTKTMNNFISVTEIEYCSSSGSADYEWIEEVTVNGQSHNSGSSGTAGYQDLTAVGLHLFAGSEHDVVLSPGFPFKNNFQYWRVWIDYNRNGQFSDAGELVLSADHIKTEVTGQISIPGGLDLSTTMRVSMKRGAAPGPCEQFAQGEVEDYTVILGEPVPMPPDANFSASTTNIAPGGQVSFTDLSANGPSSWAWTFEGGDPPTSTDQNPSVTYTSTGSFDVSLTVTNDLGSDSMTRASFIQVTQFQPPPFCTPEAVNTGLIYINSLTLGTQTSSAGPGPGGYAFYDDPVFELAPAQQYAVQVFPNNLQHSYLFKMWIDYNNDDDFFEWDETAFQASGISGNLEGTLFIPQYATGTVRLRVSLKTGDYLNPCDDGFFGEVEDYWITFKEQEPLPDTDGGGILVYPNPLDGDQVTVVVPGLQANAGIWIYSAQGELVRAGRLDRESVTFNATFMKNGIYFIRIKVGKREHMRKVVRM